MTALGEYVRSIVAAALVCSIAKQFAGSGLFGELVKLTAGMVLSIVILRPVGQIPLDEVLPSFADIPQQGERYIQEGKAQSEAALHAGIKQSLEAYVWNKAAAMNAELDIEIILSGEALPVPAGIILRGTVTADQKSALQAFLERELGIREADQRWIG